MPEEKAEEVEEVLKIPSERPTKKLKEFLEKYRKETADWAARVEERRKRGHMHPARTAR